LRSLALCLSRLCLHSSAAPRDLHSFPTRRSSDLQRRHLRPGQAVRRRSIAGEGVAIGGGLRQRLVSVRKIQLTPQASKDRLWRRSEEHTSELQSRENLVCRLLLEKKKTQSLESQR